MPQDDTRPCVLILGAEGFIGTHLRAHLADTHHLISVDVRPPTPISARIGVHDGEEMLVQCDLGDTDQIDELFEAIAPHCAEVVGVVHLAAYYDFRNTPDARYTRLQGALDYLLTRIDACLPGDAPILYASSMAAMAPTAPGERLTPDSPKAGSWAYPQHKIASEEILEAANIANPIAQLVLAGVYSDMCELVPLFQQIERVRRKTLEAYFYPGAVDRGLTYVHVEDCVRAFAQGLEHMRGEQGVQRFLIGEAEPMTYETIQHRAAEAFHGKRLPLLPMPRLLAFIGAWVLGTLWGVFGKRRFIKSWMVQFSGEHFEFDLTQTREGLEWEPERSIHDRMDRILSVANHHTGLWLEVNEGRPW